MSIVVHGSDDRLGPEADVPDTTDDSASVLRWIIELKRPGRDKCTKMPIEPQVNR